MVRIRSSLTRLALAACVVLAFGPASAKKRLKPKEPVVVEDSADVVFAKSFIGKTYDDELDVDGWEDAGGGLVVPPLYVREYRREDGAVMVLTSKEVSKAAGGNPGSYVVLDALAAGKPQKDAVFSIACVQGDDQTLRFLGEAKGSDQKEWWSDVRRAWEISLDTGTITSITPKGVKCTNPSF